jgi:hypothetical protein
MLTMLGEIGVVAAGVILLLVVRWLLRRAARPADAGSVSDSWLAHQNAGRKDGDHASSA